MNKTHTIAIAILSILLMASLTALANADTIHSFGYTVFNSAGYTWLQLDDNYTSWTIKISNKLTYNTTTTMTPVNIIVSTLNESDKTLTKRIDIVMNKNASGITNDLSIYVYDHSASALLITNPVFTYLTTPIVVSLSYDGWLSVGTEDNSTSIIEDFAVGDLTAKFIGATGIENACTAGYVTVEFGSAGFGTTNYSQTVTDWLPLIIQFAMLGMILGLLKKFGKF